MMRTELAKRLTPGAYQALREAGAYLTAVRPDRHADRVRALIFAQGRTGSTVLESLLCSSGHFDKRGELLSRRGSRVLLPEAYLRGLSKLRPSQNFICHVKLYHLTRDRVRAGRRPVDPGDFLRSLSEDGWRVIHLRRDDKMRHTMSLFVAEARGEYHKTDDRTERVKVHVERERLEAHIQERLRFDAEEQAALEGIDFHEVSYERDLQAGTAHQQTADRIFDFLGLERRLVDTPMKKVNARPLREVIANYDEFAEWVEELGWGDSLDEPRP